MSDAKHATPKQPNTASSAQQEEEVYGTLGALMGTLEVVATDDVQPVSPLQAERLQSALRISQALQYQIEALLTLAADDLDTRLRRSHTRMRPLLEHAVRGAARTFENHGVELRMPTGSDWGHESVRIDLSRVDRLLRALTEMLVTGVGAGGQITVAVSRSGPEVVLTLQSELPARSNQPAQPVGAGLLARSAHRLFQLHGGSFSLDLPALSLRITLPQSEAL